LAAQRTVEHTSENHSPFADYGGTIPRAASHSAWWWIMDEAKTARAEAIFASDEMAKAKFVNSRPIARKPRVYGRNDSLGWKPVGSNDARIPLQI